jgi:hypothetical protein
MRHATRAVAPRPVGRPSQSAAPGGSVTIGCRVSRAWQLACSPPVGFERAFILYLREELPAQLLLLQLPHHHVTSSRHTVRVGACWRRPQALRTLA